MQRPLRRWSSKDAVAGRTQCRIVSPAKIFGEGQKPSCRGFEKEKDKYEMWFKSESRGKFVHVTYAAVRDEAGDFQGVLEYVQDIQPLSGDR